MQAERYLNRSLKELVGGKTATALTKSFGIESVGDLLHHYPRRYAERGELTSFDRIEVGKPVTIMATIASVTARRMKTKRGFVLVVTVTDGKDFMELTFFNQKWREKELQVGRAGLFAGTVNEYHGVRTLTHPQYQLFGNGDTSDFDLVSDFASRIIPVYPSSQSVTSWQIAAAVDVVLASLDELDDPIPQSLLEKHELMGRAEAIRAIHQPESHEAIQRAQDRLKYQEAFVLQSLLEFRRQQRQSMSAVARDFTTHSLRESFDRSLPFSLTGGQIEVGNEIERDLQGTSPMMRLLQGDVGSGKTVVALRAILDVIESGGQAALLAPTEVLAVQHLESLSALLGDLCASSSQQSPALEDMNGVPSQVKIALLTGSMSTAARKRALLDIASGTSHLIIGTHALIQDHVDFFDLGLVVVDEQHRFGVEQRAVLLTKSRDGTRPHMLVMTATPIPRTTALTVFGDLDISTLKEVPSMRASVDTHVVSPREHPTHIARVWERMQEEVAAGNRVFVVCASISDTSTESDSDSDPDAHSDAHPDSEGGATPHLGDPNVSAHKASSLENIISVEQCVADLRAQYPSITFSALHGKMKPEEKRSIMSRFRGSGPDSIDVLVATTVIEVGVDIPDATMMVVNNAERFGISQLHQLRGRIGRGDKPGLCLLVHSPTINPVARQRLDAVAATRDGFELAQRDLEIRREGDVLGSEQSGAGTSLRLLRVVEDLPLIESVRREVNALAQTSQWPEIISAIELAEFSRVHQLEKT
jgi:ATP-dependent DNA helicase RecG